MRTDPTDTGGLFVGRRPGTAPVKYRKTPEQRPRRQRVDRVLAWAIGILMAFINLLFWGPIPAGALWVGSRVNYWTESIFLGITTAFFVCLAVLFVGLMILKSLDGLWIVVRRAAGHDQRKGIIGPMFAVCAAVGGLAFVFWFLVITGPGSSLAPTLG